jgi:hypothetical protein
MRIKDADFSLGLHFPTAIERLINSMANVLNRRLGCKFEDAKIEITQDILANLLEFLADKKIMNQDDFHKIVGDSTLEFRDNS